MIRMLLLTPMGRRILALMRGEHLKSKEALLGPLIDPGEGPLPWEGDDLVRGMTPAEFEAWVYRKIEQQFSPRDPRLGPGGGPARSEEEFETQMDLMLESLINPGNSPDSPLLPSERKKKPPKPPWASRTALGSVPVNQR